MAEGTRSAVTIGAFQKSMEEVESSRIGDVVIAHQFGLKTDAPVTTAEDGTSRSGISLLKGIKNYLRTMATGVTLAAGSAAVGKLTANSGVDIGDVDVTSTVQPVGLSTVATGERAGSATAVQLATVTARYVRLKARAANTGMVYVGTSNAVTKAAGTTTTTCGLQLMPGDDTGWLPATNLNLFWIICDNATDHLTYMVMA